MTIMNDQWQDKDKFIKRRSRKHRRRRRDGRRQERLDAGKPAKAEGQQVQAPPEREPGPREIMASAPVFLGAQQVTEETFEEELFVGDWEPKKGYLRTVDVTTALLRSVILADAGDFTLLRGEEVVLSTEKGIETGRVVTPPCWRKTGSDELKVKVLRAVGHSDVRQMSRNKAKELEAYERCRDLVRRLRLDMKLLRAQYLHGGGRVIFYFTARQRVDFRQLVKELHNTLHVRVELKQIGVRDAVKMEGGIGPCGYQVCCNRFLTSFKPVSVRMVKEQNMMMNPQKVSGICGRLLCCLEYEHRGYREHYYSLPSMGQRVVTPEGEGEVVDLSILADEAKVLDGEGKAKWWKSSELKFSPPSSDKAAAEEADEEIEVD
jgi:cell fate regulator YaaT (PSP1 superfamily)